MEVRHINRSSSATRHPKVDTPSHVWSGYHSGRWLKNGAVKPSSR